MGAIPALVEKHAKAAARVTAEAIAQGARGRIRRRAGGPTRSRHTAEGIVVEELTKGSGWGVFVDSPDMPGLPGWIEHGTKYMTARPFMANSAKLEEGPHERRLNDAIQDAIEEGGLGA